jgi:serine protease Do
MIPCRSRKLRSSAIRWTSWLVAILAAARLIAAPVGAPAGAPAAAAEVEPDTATVLNRVLPSVVNITVRKDLSAPAPASEEVAGQKPASTSPKPAPSDPTIKKYVGSGFIIDPAGVIVTNYHVVQDAFEITVTTADGSTMPGRTLSASRSADIALVKVTPRHRLTAARWGDSDRLEVGDQVFAAGNPFGLGVSVSAGIVSALDRNIQNSPYDDYIQTDAAINHGNSGGPLFDTHGQVVGVDSDIISPTAGSVGIGFAMPSNSARFVVDRLRKFGWIRPSWVGMKIQEVTPDLSNALGLKIDRGALVSWIFPDSPAQQAGLQIGDVIQRFDSRTPSDDRAILRDLVRQPVGTKVTFWVHRGDQERTITMTTQEWPRSQWDRKDAPLAVVQPKLTVPRDLGLTLADVTAAQKKTIGMTADLPGVMIQAVAPDSEPSQRNIGAGDVLLRVNDDPVDTPAAAQAKIDAARADKRNFIALLILPKVQTVPGPRWISLSLNGE